MTRQFIGASISPEVNQRARDLAKRAEVPLSWIVDRALKAGLPALEKQALVPPKKPGKR